MQTGRVYSRAILEENLWATGQSVGGNEGFCKLRTNNSFDGYTGCVKFTCEFAYCLVGVFISVGIDVGPGRRPDLSEERRCHCRQGDVHLVGDVTCSMQTNAELSFKT